jgi:2-alkenal reductase
MNPWTKRLTSLVLIAVVAVVAFYIGTMVVASNAARTPMVFPAQAQAIIAPPASASAEERLLADLYNRVAPSVVNINVISRSGGFATGDLPPDHPQVQPPDGDFFSEGTGTGFVIDTQGHIITNYHVVEGAVLIEVSFFDGTTVRGEAIGLDPDSDLAVVRVELPAESLRPVTLGDSDSAFVGQSTLAIGSPFGEEWTMTTGIISALNRTIRGLNAFSIGAVIQTDAAINPGNSGGPLLNLDGEVIGVNSQIRSGSRSNSGIGYAIPSNLVSRVAESLIAKGSVDYSYIGIGGEDVSLLVKEALSLPNNARGVLVSRVEAGSPADRAGLRNPSGTTQIDGITVPRRADIITAVDGQALTGMPDLISYLAANTLPGQTITLTVVRDGREQLELPVTLTTRPG